MDNKVVAIIFLFCALYMLNILRHMARYSDLTRMSRIQLKRLDELIKSGMTRQDVNQFKITMLSLTLRSHKIQSSAKFLLKKGLITTDKMNKEMKERKALADALADKIDRVL